MVDEGSLRVVVDERFGFDDLPAAFERFETGRKFGKILLDATGGDGSDAPVR